MELAILDVNGTLFPLDPVAERLSEAGLPGQSEVWFARILRDGFAATAAGGFAAFPDLARHHLTVLLQDAAQEVSDERLDRVIDGFSEVSAHPDVRPGLRRLADADVTVVTMTNGTVAITRDFLEREDLDDLVDASYDAQAAGNWKPAPQAYRHVLDEHDVSPRRASLIAVHPWDIQGAARAGLAAAWVNRAGDRYPEPFRRPTVQASSFDEAVGALLARAP